MPDDACSPSPDQVLSGDTLDSPNGSSPGLVLVSTPIGNLGDVSARARDVLRRSDLILCEDTRHSAHLLAVLGVSVRTEPLHEHNEDSRIVPVLARIRSGQQIAMISDAGMPVVSDPGYRLVRAAIAEGLPVTAVPGPNAAMTALVLSGLPPAPFMFLGFPPPRAAARQAGFGRLRAAERAGLAATLIWYEAPHRLAETLAAMAEAFGARPAAVARELTKHFEEVRRGLLPDLARHYAEHAARGEITVLLGPPEDNDTEDLDGRLRALLTDHTVRDAAALVTAATGLPRKLVYARALALAKGPPGAA
jgi:16S rRNA (cytidine1402-2'-O)-methyltransferase